jgi:glycosyltransferase involved in cell wall biosynthesis
LNVSVACCVYNGAAYLRPQLDSIAKQSIPPDELVVVDDGSTDGSAAIIEDFGRRFGGAITVRSVRNATQLGVTANFEKALSLTAGELLFLSDQDDVWHPEKVAMISETFAARSELDLLFTEARRIGPDGEVLTGSLFDALELTARERRLVHGGHAYEALLRRNLATGATVALRRSLFERARPFPVGWLHDEWLAIIAAATGQVDFLDAPLVDYRQHDNNQVGMRTLSLGDKVMLLGKSRGAKYAKRLAAIERLVAILEALDPAPPAGRIAEARGKLAHARFRALLPANRGRRVLPVATEALRGGYARYSTGWRAMVRDWLEPG